MDAIVAGLVALAVTEDPEKKKMLTDTLRKLVEERTEAIRAIKTKEYHIASKLHDIKEIEREIADAQCAIKSREGSLAEVERDLLIKIIDILSR